jgi:beta-phosphoglucomutase
MMNLLSFDAYFFDFDGLLADTEPVHLKAYQILLQRRTLTLPWDFATYCRYAHQKTEVFARAIFSLFPRLEAEQPDWMILREEKQAIYQDLITRNPISLMPGVVKILTLLLSHNKSMYVVTNSTQKQVEAIKKNTPFLNIIPEWVTREQYDKPKPAPDGYLKALELHGDPHCRAIGFEDAPRGIESLKAAHITPVLILPPHYPKPDRKILQDTYVFQSLVELVASPHCSQE